MAAASAENIHTAAFPKAWSRTILSMSKSVLMLSSLTDNEKVPEIGVNEARSLLLPVRLRLGDNTFRDEITPLLTPELSSLMQVH